MELEEFVARTLEQLVQGVRKAQQKVLSLGAAINPSSEIHSGGAINEPRRIDFDVAVTASEEDSAGGTAKFSIKVLSLEGGAGATTSNSTVSRIKFNIPVQLPTMKNVGTFQQTRDHRNDL